MGQNSIPFRPRRKRGGRRGAALVLILLLAGVVSALTVHAQISAAHSLRYARIRQLRAVLRLSASDAALCFLRNNAKGASPSSGTNAWAASDRFLSPSGIETEVTVREEADPRIEALLMLASPRPDGQTYMLSSAASVSGATERVSCLYRKNKGGGIEIAGWHESR